MGLGNKDGQPKGGGTMTGNEYFEKHGWKKTGYDPANGLETWSPPGHQEGSVWRSDYTDNKGGVTGKATKGHPIPPRGRWEVPVSPPEVDDRL